MTKKEMIERTRKAIEEFDALPPEEQLRRMVAWGIINEKGEVLFGTENGEKQNEVAPSNNW